MKKLVDKIIIFAICSALYITNAAGLYMIVPILVAISLSAFLSYMEDELIITAVFAAYIILCFPKPDFLFFIPLLCYDAVLLQRWWIWLFAFLPLITEYNETILIPKWLIAGLIAAAYILKYRTFSLLKVEKEFHMLRDNAKEISLQLENQNKELLEKQDYGIHLATLTERNRIARDIHDNVGHLLSRCILQIGALLTINKDELTKESLTLIKGTLSEAMDSIRASVHDLHEKAIDLQTEIEKLVHNFNFCPVKFDYDIETNLDKNIKYCFIAVTKEALSNIAKHSNCTNASVIIREHPAFYQLVIEDDGSKSNYNSENGIGVKNMTDRVAAVGGNINISTQKGFRIFISIPKK
jgi:signal transduction histidine kinase